MTFLRKRIGNTKHRAYGTRAYHSWSAMIQRCTNIKNPAFKNYGARGITVCSRWKEFSIFLADMGPRPEGLMLERKNNELGYEPGNCKWATRAEQNRNRRDIIRVTIGGKTQCLTDWCSEYGINYETVRCRIIRQGMSPVAAIQKKVSA